MKCRLVLTVALCVCGRGCQGTQSCQSAQAHAKMKIRVHIDKVTWQMACCGRGAKLSSTIALLPDYVYGLALSLSEKPVYTYLCSPEIGN